MESSEQGLREELVPGSGVYRGTTLVKDFEGHGRFRGIITSYCAPFFRVEYPEDGDVEDLELQDVLALLVGGEQRRDVEQRAEGTLHYEERVDPPALAEKNQVEVDKLQLLKKEEPGQAEGYEYEEDYFEENTSETGDKEGSTPFPSNPLSGGSLAQDPHERQNEPVQIELSEGENVHCGRTVEPTNYSEACRSEAGTSEPSHRTSTNGPSHSLPLFGSVKMDNIALGETAKPLPSPPKPAQASEQLQDLLHSLFPQSSSVPKQRKVYHTSPGRSMPPALPPSPKREPMSHLKVGKERGRPKANPEKDLPSFDKVEPRPPSFPALIVPGGQEDWKARMNVHRAPRSPPPKNKEVSKPSHQPHKLAEGNVAEEELAGGPDETTNPNQSGNKKQDLGGPTLLSLRYPGKLHESTLMVLEKVADYMDRHHIRLIDLFNGSEHFASTSLSAQEFRRQLRLRIGLHLSMREVYEIVQLLDTNGDGDVEMKELEIAVREMRRRANGREQMSSFQQLAYDSLQQKVSRKYELILGMCQTLCDENGAFDVQSFQKGLKTCGAGLSDREIKAFTKMLDPAHKGLIELNTIKNCVVFR